MKSCFCFKSTPGRRTASSPQRKAMRVGAWSILFTVSSFIVFANSAAHAQSPPNGLVSVNRFGTGGGNQGSGGPLSFSAEGRYVAFTSPSTDLAANDTNNASDVFVRDRKTGQTILVSINATGTGTGDQTSRAPTITPDGRYVAFVSFASNLVTDDAAIQLSESVFVRDLQLGITKLVSRNLAGSARGNQASGWFDSLGISDDGRYIVFASTATDLVANDNNNQMDVFVRDMQTSTTKLVSINKDGSGTGNNASLEGVITPDGRYVAFLSQARDLITMDIGFRRQVFLRDLQSATTQLVSIDRTGTTGGNGDTDSRSIDKDLSISSDGRFIAFVTDASNLVNGDNNFTQDVYVRDMQQPSVQLVSINQSGLAGGDSGQISMTPDGHFIAFTSGALNLVPNDTNQQQDVFIRNLQANSTTLVSVNPSGVAGGTGDSATTIMVSFMRPSISDDGRYVTFMSKSVGITNDNDTNGSVGPQNDVFVRDLQTGTTRLVSVNDAETNSGDGGSVFAGIMHDGKSIFYFSTASDLVGYDSNGNNGDVFVFSNLPQPGHVRFKTAVTAAGENGGPALVTISLTSPLSTPASINFTTANGTATSGVDYTSASGTVNFAAGETEKTFSVPLIDDALNEEDETVVLTLSSPTNNLTLGDPNIAALKIVNDDPLPTLSINDVTVGEGDSGTTNAIFTISLSAVSGRNVTVPVATQSLTATAPGDYRSGSAQITFLPGQTIRLVAALVNGDTNVETTETFAVNLGVPVGASIARGQGVGTIIDDDSLVLVTEQNSQRALALDSVLFTRDPFPVSNPVNLSGDQRTRIMLFATGLKLLTGEDASAVTATAEDSVGNVQLLSVEFVGAVPSFSWLRQVVLKLNAQPTSGDLKIKIILHGASSNTVLVGVRP